MSKRLTAFCAILPLLLACGQKGDDEVRTAPPQSIPAGKLPCEDTYGFRLSADNWRDTCKSDFALRELVKKTLGAGRGTWAAQEMMFRDQGCRVPAQLCAERLQLEQAKKDAAEQAEAERRQKIDDLVAAVNSGRNSCDRPILQYKKDNSALKHWHAMRVVDHAWIQGEGFMRFPDKDEFTILFLSCYDPSRAARKQWDSR